MSARDAEDNSFVVENTGTAITETNSLLDVSSTRDPLNVLERDKNKPGILVVWNELRWIGSSSFLNIFTGMLQRSFTFVNVMSVGHLGVTELAAMIISVSLINILVIAPSIGLMSAMETFCSSAYTASRNKTAIGFHFQRGIIAAFAHFAIVTPILWNGNAILLALGQDTSVSKLCGVYLRIHILGVLPWTLFEACKRFLSSQEIMRAGTVILIYAAPFHWTLNYFLVRSKEYGLGFVGAPIANVATEWLMFVSAVIYIYNSRASEAWGAWSFSALRNMSEYYRLAIPSVIAVCSDFVGFHIVTIQVSYFGIHQVGGHAIILNIASYIAQISECIGAGTGPRVGNLIGAGKPRQAQIASNVAIALSTLTNTIFIVLITLYSKLWISLYTDDYNVVYEATKLIPSACFIIAGDGLNCLLAAIMRGLGRQKVGAIVNATGFIILALPIELMLAFWFHMESIGVWTGLCVGVLFTCMVQLLYLFAWLDWKDEVRLCHIRLYRSGEGITNENEEQRA